MQCTHTLIDHGDRIVDAEDVREADQSRAWSNQHGEHRALHARPRGRRVVEHAQDVDPQVVWLGVVRIMIIIVFLRRFLW